VCARCIGDSIAVVAADHFAVIFEYADRRHWIPNGNELYRIKVGMGCVPSPKTFRPALGPIQPCTQWVTLFFSGGTSPRREVDTHLHVMQSLRMCGSILLLPLYAFISQTREILAFAQSLISQNVAELRSVVLLTWFYPVSYRSTSVSYTLLHNRGLVLYGYVLYVLA
jgi:hypothetical protein